MAKESKKVIRLSKRQLRSARKLGKYEDRYHPRSVLTEVDRFYETDGKGSILTSKGNRVTKPIRQALRRRRLRKFIKGHLKYSKKYGSPWYSDIPGYLNLVRATPE